LGSPLCSHSSIHRGTTYTLWWGNRHTAAGCPSTTAISPAYHRVEPRVPAPTAPFNHVRGVSTTSSPRRGLHLVGIHAQPQHIETAAGVESRRSGKRVVRCGAVRRVAALERVRALDVELVFVHLNQVVRKLVAGGHNEPALTEHLTHKVASCAADAYAEHLDALRA